MNKKYWILIIISGVALLLLIIFLLLQFTKQNNSNNSNSGNAPQAKVNYNGPRISIPNQANNQPVSVGDFVPNAYLETSVATVIYSDSEMSIQYDKINSQFQITLIGTDPEALNQIRYNAEKMFLEKLAISEQDACKLKVQEIIPYTPSLNLNSYQFPMSFCEGK